MSEVRLTPEQQAVVENRGGSLLVSAAAGSGKTKVLVERLFRYVTEEHCNVDDFLIITYTRAAAAELRSKIAAELSKRLAASPGDRHLRSQLLRVYQADIRTVDAFCTSLLRENTHLLSREEDTHSLSPDFRVLDENEAKLLRERVLNRVLETFYDQLDEGGQALADTLGFGRDDRVLAELVLDLCEKIQSHAYPDRWLGENQDRWTALQEGGVDFDDTPYAGLLLESVRRQTDYWAGLLRRSAEQMAGCPALEKGYAGRFFQAADGLDALSAAASQGRWETARQAMSALSFPRLGVVKDADGGEQKARAKKLWDGCKDAAKKWSALLNISGEETVEDLAATAPAMMALLRLTRDFAQAYRKEKLRQNAADFSDQEHLALQILVREDGAPTELGTQVSARYREILVDEYQDTNEVQNAIFQAVSRQGQNLFTVGDVKQSIYRFRLADPTIFLEKYGRFKSWTEATEGEERKILLSKNFRSRREILDAANFTFENILSREMGEMDYGEDEALHFGAEYYPPRTDCGTEFHLIRAQMRREGEERPVKRLTAEARFVATRIRKLLDDRWPVTDSDGTLRPCRPEDIVILMRSPGSRSAAYADALAEQEIPCAFEESGDFFSTMEISTMLALLELIDNPRQDVPLISVLRSPVFGFTPDRLAAIRGKTREGDFYQAVEKDGGEDCRAFLDTLSDLRLLARDLSVHQLLWTVYNRLNVLGIFGAMDGGKRRRENLIALGEHAEKLEGSGYWGVFAFITQLRRLIETGRAPQTRGASDSAGVRIMSIHKSKGLEFPVVILTDLDHAFSQQDFKTPVLVHPALGLGPMRVDLERKIKYPTMARRCIEEALTRENKAEEQRILYVAMTRPKEKLILVDAMYHTGTRMERLVPLAACPAPPESVGEGKNFADWLLLPLLCRPEAAPLRQIADMQAERLYTGDTAPWEIAIHEAEEFRQTPAYHGWGDKTPEAEETFDPALLEFVYPYQTETTLPAKLTATQLKGRELDSEIAEEATVPPPPPRPLTRPKFRQELAGLTAAEGGTATHLVLQYLDFSNLNVAEQVAELLERHLLTEEQAAAVRTAELRRFLCSALAEELRQSPRILREYPFTVLMDAAEADPSAVAGDKILLQGIVDCCFEQPDGTLAVVDFKTDHVSGDALQARAEHYRTQLTAYSKALTRVLECPVSRRILYFLHTGEAVEL